MSRDDVKRLIVMGIDDTAQHIESLGPSELKELCCDVAKCALELSLKNGGRIFHETEDYIIAEDSDGLHGYIMKCK